MQEELNQFDTPPNKYPIIETKWVFRNKLNWPSNVVRNKVELVTKGYNQEQGFNYDETFCPVARCCKFL